MHRLQKEFEYLFYSIEPLDYLLYSCKIYPDIICGFRGIKKEIETENEIEIGIEI